MDAALIAGLIVALVAVFTVLRSVRIVPQARAGNVERLGRYYRTLGPGLNFVIPFIDRVRPLIDLREQVVSFKPQPVITEDNLVVDIDTVLYFQVTDPRAAAYEIANFIQGVEQLTVTTLRNVVGGMDLEKTLTSRDTINSQLRGVLDEATGKWGIRVNRVEIKAIDPPKTIKEAMEKQMRAERDKRAAILTAEGQRQSQILTAEGEKQSAILRAEGERTAQILKAEGQSRAIDEVFQAVHRNDPDPKLLAYQYLQVLPQLAQGQGNTFWVIPSEVTSALQGVSKAFTEALPVSPALREREDHGESEAVAEAERAAAEARAAAEDSELGPRQIASGRRSFDPLTSMGGSGAGRDDVQDGPVAGEGVPSPAVHEEPGRP
ncbi:SPFH domain-containing protein [Microbispora corallina]|uniref:Paraslipin n=1 Tax=Microbispora corallina TaxID=83302 RepID=A0ABQ4G746_9ACTN|nr:SPFH domain-containing protein [Microbispora corallina]GIH42889.1 paraslipin [Microbispora corallina]